MSVALKNCSSIDTIICPKIKHQIGVMAMVELGIYKSIVISNKSFRTVIPKPIAKALGLQHKVATSWELKVEDGKVLAVMEKA